jgi:hypothetical protein
LLHLNKHCILCKNQTWGGFHKAIYAFMLKIYALRPSFLHKNILIWNYVLGPCAQLIVFSPRFGCALPFTSCTQLLWNPPYVRQKDTVWLVFFGGLPYKSLAIFDIWVWSNLATFAICDYMVNVTLKIGRCLIYTYLKFKQLMVLCFKLSSLKY